MAEAVPSYACVHLLACLVLAVAAPMISLLMRENKHMFSLFRISQVFPFRFPVIAVAPGSRRQDLILNCPHVKAQHVLYWQKCPATLNFMQTHCLSWRWTQQLLQHKPKQNCCTIQISQVNLQKKKKNMGQSLLREGDPWRLCLSPQHAWGQAVHTLSHWVPLDRWALTSRAGHRAVNRCCKFCFLFFTIKARPSVMLWGH